MQTFHVDAPAPLLAFLAGRLKNRTQAKQYLRLRQISVNGETADRHDAPLATGDVIRIGPPRRFPKAIRLPGKIDVLFEDDAILVIDKPAGLLTIATESIKSDTAYFKVTEYLRESSDGGRIFIVHRLDRDTSGLLVFAKTEDAKQRLQDSWEEVEKRYYAIVEGIPAELSGKIESHLTETKVFQVFSGRQTSRSKHAVTRYTVLESAEDRSLLEVVTETGRKHQIRVHLADLGHPIVGDRRYGKARGPGRLGLHASYLRFRHPTTDETIEFRSSLPADMARGFASQQRHGRRRPAD